MHLLAHFCHIPQPFPLGPASSLASSPSSTLHQRLTGWPWVWAAPEATKHSRQSQSVLAAGTGHKAALAFTRPAPPACIREGRKWPRGLSGCSCCRKLPAKCGGCGELKPRGSVNKEKGDQACQIFRLRMTLQQEGDGRNSWAWLRGWEGVLGSHSQARG